MDALADERVFTLLKRIRETVDSESEVRTGIAKLYPVENLGTIALRMLWLLDRGRADGRWPDDAIIMHEAGGFAREMAGLFGKRAGENTPQHAPDPIDGLNAFSAHTETLKRDITPAVRRSTVQALKQIAEQLVPHLRSASRLRSAEMLIEYAAFIAWAQKHKVETEDKAVAILHTANITLQTSIELGEGECEETISRTLDILRNPERVFGIHVMQTSEIHG